MTFDIALVLAILGAAVVLFITERLRVDLVAILVLASLALTGLVSASEALAGFSNPAVVTVWAVFILSGALARTGVAGLIGSQVLRLAGTGERRLTLTIMLTAAVMSAFMNNVGVAALLLPVVIDIARRTKLSPGRLLLPLAYGSLLGGLMTLIGTPPNILISDALREANLEPFSLFDYSPVGVIVMLVGVLFVVFVGRYLLPPASPVSEDAEDALDLRALYRLDEFLFVLRVPVHSGLVDHSLREARLGSILGLTVINIQRNSHHILSPDADQILAADDRLLVVGRMERLNELRSKALLTFEPARLTTAQMIDSGFELVEMELSTESDWIDRTLLQAELRQRYRLNVLSIRRDNAFHVKGLNNVRLQPGDRLILSGREADIGRIAQETGFTIRPPETEELALLERRLLRLRIPPGSALVGNTLAESRLGRAFELTVLQIRRAEQPMLPEPDEVLAAEDVLWVEGDPDAVLAIQGLEELLLDQSPPARELLQTAQTNLAEAVLQPRGGTAGQSLRQIQFREKYGLNVLAIWRGGRARRSGLGDLPLHFGDALLLFGPRERLMVLGREQDFLLLHAEAQVEARTSKALLSVSIMALVLLPVMMGWLPIAISAVAGSGLMVLSGCLSMEEAYQYIEWPAVFLIAGMLPLGTALENSGAAALLATQMVALVGGLGPMAVLIGLFVLSVLASQVMPNPAVAVLMAPIALSTASDMGVSPYAMMMTVAIASSASFLSPVSHPANVLVMGPGGYRFGDYIRVGLPLTLLVLVVVVLVMPVFWPL